MSINKAEPWKTIFKVSAYKKRLLKTLRFEVSILRKELEEIRPIFEEACSLFASRVASYCSSHEVVNPLEDWGDDKKDKTSQELDHPFKVIFRKIAVRTHPDKHGGESNSSPLTKSYIGATKAQEESDVFELFSIASELKIDTSELTFNEIDSLRQAIKEKREEANNIYNSMVLKWYYANNKAKEKFIKSFIECNIS